MLNNIKEVHFTEIITYRHLREKWLLALIIQEHMETTQREQRLAQPWDIDDVVIRTTCTTMRRSWESSGGLANPCESHLGPKRKKVEAVKEYPHPMTKKQVRL